MKIFRKYVSILVISLLFLTLIGKNEVYAVIAPPSDIRNILDNTVTDGFGVKTVLGWDGNPIVVFVDDLTPEELKVVKCSNIDCSEVGAVQTLVTTGASAVRGVDIVIGHDGNPVISYVDPGNSELRVIKCNDKACDPSVPDGEGAETNFLVDDTEVDPESSIEIGSDGNPVIVYRYIDSMRVAKCNDSACNPSVPDGGGQEKISVVESGTGFAHNSDIKIDSNGNPVIAYNYSSDDVRLVRCNDEACDSSVPDGDGVETINEVSATSGHDISLQLDSDDNPAVLFSTNTNQLRFVKCTDRNCGAKDTTVLVTGVGDFVLDYEDKPMLSYKSIGSPSELSFIHCDNLDCSGDQSSNTIIVNDDFRGDIDIMLNLMGIPILATFEYSTGDLLAEVLVSNTPTLTGSIDLSGRNSGDMGIEVQTAATEIFTISSDGSFIGAHLDKSYPGFNPIYLKPKYYISQKVLNSADYRNNDIGTVGDSFRWGDLNNDDKVNAIDFGHIVVNWGSGSTEIHDGDYNADGEINSLDYGGFVLNYNETGEHLDDFTIAWEWE